MDYYIKNEQPNNTWSRERINVGRMAHNCIVSCGEFLSFLLAFCYQYKQMLVLQFNESNVENSLTFINVWILENRV
jgi:hypothetical protein